MSKNQKMDFKLNSAPHLKMSDITKRLFNRKFLSDVRFCVEDKIIYAHSLELMKRSEVFEKQLEETLGDKKLIPIVGYTYESFYEFIRFIYTDDCDLTVDNGIELLKLAKQYKVIMLENKVINLTFSVEWGLKLLEHCVLDKYDIVRNVVDDNMLYNFNVYLMNKQFLSLPPEAMEAILQLERLPTGVFETQLFIGLGNWITWYCKGNQMGLSEGRQRFDKLIRKIRFPAMSPEEIQKCIKHFPGLLTASDCIAIADRSENNLWASTCREKFIDPYEYGTFKHDNVFQTRLSVSKDTVLHGIRIGNCLSSKSSIEMEIFTANSEKLVFRLIGSNLLRDLTFSFGNSLCLKSNCEYTITIKYLDVSNPNMKVRRRKRGVYAIVNDAARSVRIIQIGWNVLEMFFNSSLD